ncbi:serpin family protein [Metaplanococcus flavidus]|uniref:Serpin family protein n=1 Tax=Metaplanococcus flavidus TaxID=569883 RepID=A0ABW3LFX2_9BACL
MKKLIQLLIVTGLLTAVSGCGIMQDQDQASMKIADHVEYGETDYELIAEANNILGMKLLKDLSAKEDGNIFVSPTSLYMALAMVYNGAEGATKDEIAKVLEAEGLAPEEMNKANASLVTKLASDTEDIELNIANSIWAKEGYTFRESFTESSQDYYNARLETIDITDPASADAINDWVSDATNERIDKMAESPLPGNLVAMLLNAIYFNGAWQYPFPEDATVERPFHLEDGSTAQVPLMSLNEQLSYLETDNFQAVSLPYGEGEMNMHVFLPAETSSLDEFKASMNEEEWAGWMAGFESNLGTVMLPKFELEYEVNLNDTLQELGMETAFSSADLSKMFETSSGLLISEVKQKSFINVSEEGTEAAAVTSIGVDTSGPAEPPFELIVDRPFFFAITDEETGVILFMGSIENPV